MLGQFTFIYFATIRGDIFNLKLQPRNPQVQKGFASIAIPFSCSQSPPQLPGRQRVVRMSRVAKMNGVIK